MAEPAILEDIHKIILGNKYQEPVVRTLFEAYLEAAPKAEKKVLYAWILSSFVDSPVGTDGVSLKIILESMGPFGVKAGQFLATSGLLPAEYSRDLKDFLSNALPPDRSRVINDLEEALGSEFRGIVSIDERIGSGSINYVQAVTAEVDGEIFPAVVRVRRDYLEGVVANENDIWEKVVQSLRSSGDSLENTMADIIEEARRQSMSTLSADGPELDLSIERENFQAAGRLMSDPSMVGGYGWPDPMRPSKKWLTRKSRPSFLFTRG